MIMKKPEETDAYATRGEWLNWLERLAMPVLRAGANGVLDSRMPNENPKRGNTLASEALARTLAGIAPFLSGEKGDLREHKLRTQLADLARKAIAEEVHPDATGWVPGEAGFLGPRQQLVECAFLSEAILRAPEQLFFALENQAQKNVVAVLEASRKIIATGNNWILFSAMVEACLKHTGRPWEQVRVAYALNQFAHWYKGDGAYGDGEFFHYDYYNSFVIQPFLLEISRECADSTEGYWMRHSLIQQRAVRFAEVLERMIAPDGTWPVLGRSMTYRSGCFHLLALLSNWECLPDNLTPGQVRCALTATIRRSLNAENTFNENGWLQLGLCGSQPSLGEFYINNGSLYLCCQALLPLGLSPNVPFWSQADQPWTSAKAWSGCEIGADHALHDK